MSRETKRERVVGREGGPPRIYETPAHPGPWRALVETFPSEFGDVTLAYVRDADGICVLEGDPEEIGLFARISACVNAHERTRYALRALLDEYREALADLLHAAEVAYACGGSDNAVDSRCRAEGALLTDVNRARALLARDGGER